jgi:hypothetical protein
LNQYITLANHPEQIGVCISCDADDATMTPDSVQYQIKNITHRAAWCEIYYGTSKSKIEAVNADMASVTYEWDMVVLVSDDMVPQVAGYDDVLRTHMMANFADTDGILWVNDGTQGTNLNTISIMGRKMYDSFGYLYHPDYKSLYCDTEFTDLCNGPLASKCTYIPYVLIKHEHPGTGFPEKDDALYARNMRFWTQDMYTYVSRKKYDHEWSILIATIVGREQKLVHLLERINELKAKICPDVKIKVYISFDNKEKKIGAKRQDMLREAKGRYVSFIDDDDLVTEAYFEDALATIQGGFHVCRLRGQMNQYTFTHSTENTLDMPMAIGDVFVRPPNHLNIMQTEIARLIPFRNVVRGEDLDWTIRLAQTRWLQTEYRSDPSRIHYIYNMGDRVVHEGTLIQQRQTNYSQMLKMLWGEEGAVEESAQPSAARTAGLRLSGRGFVSK